MTITGIINLPISILNFNIEVVIGSRPQLMEYKCFPVLSPETRCARTQTKCRACGCPDVLCISKSPSLQFSIRSPGLTRLVRWLPHPSHRDNEEPGPIWHPGDKFRLLSSVSSVSGPPHHQSLFQWHVSGTKHSMALAPTPATALPILGSFVINILAEHKCQ